VRKADNLPPSCAVVTKSGNLKFLKTSGPVMGLLYLFYLRETSGMDNAVHIQCDCLTILHDGGQHSACCYPKLPLARVTALNIKVLLAEFSSTKSTGCYN